MSQTGDEGARERAGGFIPRHSETFAAIAADTPTVWRGQNARAFRVGWPGHAGDVTVTDESGADCTFYNVAVDGAETVVCAFSAIKATGTTATEITVFWA